MVYNIMAHHSELVLLLRERKSSSLINLLEDVEEVKENIKDRKGVHTQAYHEKLHVHKQEYCQYVSDSEQEDCQYVSNSKQEDSEYNSDLEQQQGGRCDSHLESGSSIVAYFSMGRDAYQSYDQFS
jgi:hypothetical protein